MSEAEGKANELKKKKTILNRDSLSIWTSFSCTPNRIFFQTTAPVPRPGPRRRHAKNLKTVHHPIVPNILCTCNNADTFSQNSLFK